MTEVDIPSPLMDFIAAHEIYCVAGCCGEDAFDYTPEAIAGNEWSAKAIAALDLDLARRQLEEFRERARSCDDEPSNDRLNRYWESAAAVDQWCGMIGGLIDSDEAYLKSKEEAGQAAGSDGGKPLM